MQTYYNESVTLGITRSPQLFANAGWGQSRRVQESRAACEVFADHASSGHKRHPDLRRDRRLLWFVIGSIFVINVELLVSAADFFISLSPDSLVEA